MMSTIPTMFEIISMYLYGQKTKPEDYLDEKYIGRSVDAQGIGSTVTVNASEFMTTGAGRYIDVGNFLAVRKFLAGEYNLAPKTYTTEQFYDAIGYPAYQTNTGAHLGVSNYGLDTNSADYLDRAYVFGSMEFMINEDARFIVENDGSFKIENIAVVPLTDNFDYDGGGIAAGVTNFLTKDVIDPYGIGKTVKIIFDKLGEVPKVDLSEGNLLELINQQDYFDSINRTVSGQPVPNVLKLAEGLKDILSYDLTHYFDSENRLIIYGTNSADSSSILTIKAKYLFDLAVLARAYREFPIYSALANKIADIQDAISNSNGIYYIAGGGNDEVNATSKNDIVYGGSGNDELYGGDGADVLYGGNDLDKLYGGDGNDTLIVSGSSSEEIALDTFNNEAYGGDGNDYLYGGNGDDHLEGGKDVDVLYGVGGDDTLKGDEGNDRLYGGNGGDQLYGGDDDDLLFAGEGENDSRDKSNNHLFGGLGDDKLFGAVGNDILVGNGGDDYLYGGDGNDKLYAGDEGNGLRDRGGEGDFLYGGKGDDTLYYTKSILFGGEERLEGGEGFDTYKTDGKLTIMDEDGKGILFYKDKNLLGANMNYQSDTLSLPEKLDFSKNNYDINDKTTARLVEIIRTEDYVRYLVTGDINFKYKDLTTEGLDNRELGIKFYVTVYKDMPPAPPIFQPPKNLPTPSDPLVLDLNHDGLINTTHISEGINFDLDGNQFAENTSWVSGQDGFVVLDINENGVIDNGSELFGTDTLLADGTKANDGFIALAQYDKNQDQVIDNKDDIYKDLKIWKDLNQDGISQTEELYSLSDLGITSISLAKKAINVTDSNSVTHTNQAEFTQQILENGVLKEITGLTETLLFQVNTSNTVWQGDNPSSEQLPADILSLPDIPGYGSVTSLHIAMASDTTGTLKGLVTQFEDTADLDEQLELTRQILLYWTNSQHIPVNASTFFSNGMSMQQFSILKALWGKETEWKNWTPHDTAARELEGYYQKILENLYSQLYIQTKKTDWMDFIVFKEEQVYTTSASNGSGTIQYSTFNGKPPSVTVEEKGGSTSWQLIDTIWHADFSLLIERLIDTLALDNQSGKDQIQQLKFIIHSLDPNHTILYSEFFKQATDIASTLEDKNISHLFLAEIYKDDDDISGTSLADIIRSFSGDDVIQALAGDDQLYGGEGDDQLYGGEGDDQLYGDEGNDRIYGGDGNDALIGGTGNDYLDGGVGNDNYIFSLGDGQDTIQSYEYNPNKLDRIVFSEGIAPKDVSLKRQG
ncbi:hypothetical protein P255_02663, partial [Acinetobacter brisouii CIP 110357]